MHAKEFKSRAVRQLREDLALALRAAAHHGLGEGICNHFSVELPDESKRFLINCLRGSTKRVKPLVFMRVFILFIQFYGR